MRHDRYSVFHAFTLMELAVVVALMGLMAGGFIRMQHVPSPQAECNKKNLTQLARVREAFDRYAATNNRFPMPAQRNVGSDDPMSGREASTSALNVVAGRSGGAIFGALPFQTLGIAPQEAIDCWGNKLTYVVTADLTVSATFRNTTVGAIDIETRKGDALFSGVGYAIISHGADGLGATKANYQGPDKQWCSLDPTARLRTENCEISNAVLVNGEFNDGKDAAGAYFDDALVYRTRPWTYAIDGECDAEVPGRCKAGDVAGLTLGECSTAATTNYDTWTCSGRSFGASSPLCKKATASCPPSSPPTGTDGAGDTPPGIETPGKVPPAMPPVSPPGTEPPAEPSGTGPGPMLPPSGAPPAPPVVPPVTPPSMPPAGVPPTTPPSAPPAGEPPTTPPTTPPSTPPAGEPPTTPPTTPPSTPPAGEPPTTPPTTPPSMPPAGVPPTTPPTTPPAGAPPAGPPVPITCSYSGTLNWGAGCSAGYSGTVSDGSSITVESTAKGASGSLTYQCSGGSWAPVSASCTPKPLSCPGSPPKPPKCKIGEHLCGAAPTCDTTTGLWNVDSYECQPLGVSCF